MVNPAFTTTNMPQQIGAHHSPSKARPPAHSSVCVLDTEHALLNKIYDLQIKRRLKSVCYMAWKFTGLGLGGFRNEIATRG